MSISAAHETSSRTCRTGGTRVEKGHEAGFVFVDTGSQFCNTLKDYIQITDRYRDCYCGLRCQGKTTITLKFNQRKQNEITIRLKLATYYTL